MLLIDPAVAMLASLPIRDRYSRRLVPFKAKFAQAQIICAARRQQARGRPIRIIILKARRVGGSAITDGLGFLHCIADPGMLGLIVAHQFKSSKGLFEVPTNLAQRHLPRAPASFEHNLGVYITKQFITVPHKEGESQLDLATAGSVTSGRGLGKTFLHLSEAAYFPAVQSFTSLLPMVPYDPSTILVVESTANGRTGPGAGFYDMWMKAVAGENNYEAVFIPWHMDPSYRRPPEDAADAPVGEYEEWLMREFKCDKAQIAWWRATLEDECKGNLTLMQQEYPASPEEAFIVSGDPAFEHAELEYARSQLAEPSFEGDFSREEEG
jgi:hypothetical protein